MTVSPARSFKAMEMTLPSPEFSQREFRDTLGLFPTGVSVVTSVHHGEPVAATIGSFGSVSLDPPLVLFSIARSSKAYAIWSAVGEFAVNILDSSQTEISNTFARALTDKWKDVAPLPGSQTDTLLLPGAVAWLECETYQRIDGGDHLIVLGKVVALSRNGQNSPSPLVFCGGRYRSLMAVENDTVPNEEALWFHGW